MQKRKNIWTTPGYLIEYMYRDDDLQIVHSIKHFKSYCSFSKFFKRLLDDTNYWIKRVYKV